MKVVRLTIFLFFLLRCYACTYAMSYMPDTQRMRTFFSVMHRLEQICKGACTFLRPCARLVLAPYNDSGHTVLSECVVKIHEAMAMQHIYIKGYDIGCVPSYIVKAGISYAAIALCEKMAAWHWQTTLAEEFQKTEEAFDKVIAAQRNLLEQQRQLAESLALRGLKLQKLSNQLNMLTYMLTQVMQLTVGCRFASIQATQLATALEQRYTCMMRYSEQEDSLIEGYLVSMQRRQPRIRRGRTARLKKWLRTRDGWGYETLSEAEASDEDD